MMRRLLFCLCLLLSSPALALVEASVDRTRLVEGETLELTLESGAANRFSNPELTVLEEHFDIRVTRQLSLVSQLNGRSQPVTRWVITLAPKRTGYVVIPPIELEDARSEPISLHVLSAAEAARDNKVQMAPVFIDTEMDTETPYVQAQVLMTLRIYHSLSLYDDSNLTGLEIPDTRVESLGAPRQYERVINGVRHGVIEIRYALFPQRSGALEIPSQLFSATTLQPRDASPPLSARAGRLVQVRSPSIRLEVQPIPASYPADAPWLPARAVTLAQVWQPDPQLDLLSGESLTRSLSIEADGLSAMQLPALGSLDGMQIEGLRQYADQPKLDNIITDSGVRGVRQDSAALLVQQAGEFLIPAQTLYWWDTQADTLQQIELKAVTLNVVSSERFIAAAAAAEPATSNDLGALDQPLLWPWQLASALLVMALSACLVLLYRSRQRLAMLDQPHPDEAIFDAVVQGNPLADLQTACRANQPAEARKALESWARQQQDAEGLIGITQRHPELADALDDLNASLFGQTESHWRGKPLWRAVRMVVQSQKRQPPDQGTTLDSLYPHV
ncbi:MAG: BatD family protein [Halopseudomonas sp.]